VSLATGPAMQLPLPACGHPLSVREPRFLVAELSSSGDLGETLRSLLTSAGLTNLHLYRQDDGSTTAANGADDRRLTDVFTRCHPDLCFLAFSAASLNQAFPFFRRVKTLLSGVSTIAVTDACDPAQMLELLSVGVADFVTLPLRPVDIYPRIWRLIQTSQADEPLTPSLKERLGLKQLVGESPAFLEQIKKISVVAKTDATVLVLGETGTGKELCARAIHYLSHRAGLPFVPVTCGAIPQELVENELFGHAAGAFTGATAAKPGLIQEAQGGTLLLDEVDSLPLKAQVNLLRFLQEREYRPLGSSKAVSADVRVIAASNTDLTARVRSGALRQDLYYRLNVVPLTLPPLRERPEDVLPLANHFAAKYAEAFDRPLPKLSIDAQQLLLCYEWPGNVRELEHVMERAVLFAGPGNLSGLDLALPRAEANGRQESFQEMKARAVAQFERSCIQRLLLANEGNISRAARAAQKNRRAFFELIRKHRIDARELRLNQ
jgi:two-component system response regulator GlrR